MRRHRRCSTRRKASRPSQVGRRASTRPARRTASGTAVRQGGRPTSLHRAVADRLPAPVGRASPLAPCPLPLPRRPNIPRPQRPRRLIPPMGGGFPRPADGLPPPARSLASITSVASAGTPDNKPQEPTMTINPETVPSTWTTDDENFFRVAFDVFSPDFLAGAGVLLASYDDEQTAITIPTPAVATTESSIDAPAPTVR